MCTNKVSDIICFSGSQDYKAKQSFKISWLVLWANKQALPVMKDKTRTKSQLITSVHEWACLGWNFLQILCKHYLHTAFESTSHSQRGRCQGQESSLRFANIASHVQPQSQSKNSTTTFDGSLSTVPPWNCNATDFLSCFSRSNGKSHSWCWIALKRHS
jgi:hypothetical protein